MNDVSPVAVAAAPDADLPFWHRTPVVLMTVYATLLAAIAVWPTPVDRPAHGVLTLVTRWIPVLTYARIEFTANIALFVPFGVLLALILARRHLVVPIALVVTVTIESVQGLFLVERTPSVLDVVANLTGACVGLLLVEVVEARRRRRR